jgi:hypothetical protein
MPQLGRMGQFKHDRKFGKFDRSTTTVFCDAQPRFGSLVMRFSRMPTQISPDTETLRFSAFSEKLPWDLVPRVDQKQKSV